ncbi:MAG: aminopeptidase P family protein [Acetobacteraceae bacterium]
MTLPASRDSIRHIRAQLSAEGLDGMILPRGDEFLGEYVAPYAERLAWLTGFTGSAGLAILLQEEGAVFSDGRYTEQLRSQLDPSIWSAQSLVAGGPQKWAAARQGGLKLGFDPRLASEAIFKNFDTISSVTLVPLSQNPIDAAWVTQPEKPDGRVQLLELQFSGQDSLQKRTHIGQILAERGHDAALITDPTCLAWLLNMRGNDVPYTPVVLGFGLITPDGAVTAFIDKARLPENAATHFGPGVTFAPPETLPQSLENLRGKIVRLDPESASVWFRQHLDAIGAKPVRDADPCHLLKAQKNDVELDGARRIQKIDSAALCKFLHFVTKSGVGCQEAALADHLYRFRSEAPEFREESFPAISAAGPNAALPHYRAIKGQDRDLTASQIYLIDSGGQYEAGTTDVTRTIWIGPNAPDDAICDAFTRVLKGHIAIARAVFPVGTPGYRLDPLARYALWQAGLDYDHGTGHGVGSYLSVHEGPQNISAAPRPTPLMPGMIVSNEPGYYEPGHYGIRSENLLIVKDAPRTGSREFLAFETLNYAPFDRKMIRPVLLSAEEIDWINAYHAKTREEISPLLEGDARAWLMEACAPLNC